MGKKVIVIGAGGHGRVIADIIRESGDEMCGFIDDCPPPSGGLTILGGMEAVGPISRQGEFCFIVAIGDNNMRKSMIERYRLPYYTVIHPSAVVAGDVVIGAASAVMANAVVGTGSRLGRGVIVNTAATVDHDGRIGDFVHLSPGVHLSGTVDVGEGCWLGTGTVVRNNVALCAGCRTGAGAVVVRDITEPGLYVGVPCAKIR